MQSIEKQKNSTRPDIMDVVPLGAHDDECLKEIRDVLLRHGKIDRFGITLIHDHFHMDSDEALIEDCDPHTRTLTIRPEKLRKNLSSPAIETSWELGRGEVLTVCRVRCRYNANNGEHVKDHDMS